MMGNAHNFNVLCRNELTKPTSMLLCSAWSHPEEQLNGFHLANWSLNWPSMGRGQSKARE